MVDVVAKPTPEKEIPINGFERIEFYVGNAKQAAHFYHHALGFSCVAYKGPETGSRDVCSYVLRQNDITFVMTSALTPNHEVNAHVDRHGDGIKDVGFAVDDVEAAYKTAMARGATSVMEPVTLTDSMGTVTKATIATYGDTTHTFICRNAYKGVFEPGFVAKDWKAQPIALQRVDHAVGNLPTGDLDKVVSYYETIFGFHVFRFYDEHDISTQYSALVSKVMANASGSIKLPLNEPAPGVGKSQIQEFLDYYHSAGVQHLAIHTSDIVHTVTAMRASGIELMTVPDTYYQELPERVGLINEPIEPLQKLGILVDREGDGYLLQIFTLPVQDRPTFFFEIIQRCGADGFGKGNFKALFEAIERDQARRGNLLPT